jgi:hypothetical protein
MAAKLLSAVASCPASAPRLVRIGLDLGFGRNDRVGDLSFEKSHRMSFSVFCGRELPRHQQAPRFRRKAWARLTRRPGAA